MRGDLCRSALKLLMLMLRAASALIFLALNLHAQDSAPSQVPPPPASDTSAEIRALTASLLELKSQLQSMNAQLAELRKEQDRARAEARELHKQLEAALARSTPGGASALSYEVHPTPSSPAPSSVGSTTVSSPTSAPAQEIPDRLSQLEENEQLLDAKISDQYQTKVESGSKYRVRLSGIVLLNVFANRGAVDNQDFPQVAASDDSGIAQNTFGASLRQSQIGLEAFGPDVAGAHTSADLKFDFAGGFADASNGDNMGLVRLRTGTIRMDWTNTSLVAGQDRLFFAPLAPTSLASLAVPALSYNGNLWGWIPQVRIEHSIHISENSGLLLQGGILDAQDGEEPADDYVRLPTSGEASGQPAYAARVAWRQRSFGQQWTLGFGGYYSRENWGSGRNVDSWTGTTDLSLPLGKYFGFTGEFYRGRAVGGLGGGIGQSILWNGPITDPTTVIKGLDSMGGWAQLKFKPKAKLEFNGAFGQDNPYASQLRAFPWAGDYYGTPLSRSHSAFGNVIYQVKSDFLVSAEYRRMRTFDITNDSYAANHINLSVAYIF